MVVCVNINLMSLRVRHLVSWFQDPDFCLLLFDSVDQLRIQKEHKDSETLLPNFYYVSRLVSEPCLPSQPSLKSAPYLNANLSEILIRNMKARGNENRRVPEAIGPIFIISSPIGFL